MRIWTFQRTSKFIRFYLWLYLSDATQVNFCKLFWGYLFSPIALIFRTLGKTPVAHAIADGAARETDRISHWAQRHPKLVRLPVGLIMAYWVALLGYLAYLWFCNPVTGAIIFGSGVGAAAIIVGLFFGIGWFYHTDSGQTFFQWVRSCGRSFADFCDTAYHAIKDRSCPKVTIK